MKSSTIDIILQSEFIAEIETSCKYLFNGSQTAAFASAIRFCGFDSNQAVGNQQKVSILIWHNILISYSLQSSSLKLKF